MKVILGGTASAPTLTARDLLPGDVGVLARPYTSNVHTTPIYHILCIGTKADGASDWRQHVGLEDPRSVWGCGCDLPLLRKLAPGESLTLTVE